MAGVRKARRFVAGRPHLSTEEENVKEFAGKVAVASPAAQWHRARVSERFAAEGMVVLADRAGGAGQGDR
jgi:hypothetical protein